MTSVTSFFITYTRSKTKQGVNISVMCGFNILNIFLTLPKSFICFYYFNENEPQVHTLMPLTSSTSLVLNIFICLALFKDEEIIKG